MKKPRSNALRIVRQYFPGVAQVADAAKSAIIEVTPKDSTNSTVQNHTTCAYAMACKRQMKADGVIIGTKTAYIIHGKRAVRYRMNESVAREIVSFDRRAGFAVGVYQLRAPTESERLGAPSGATHNPSERRAKLFRHLTSNIRASLGRHAAAAILAITVILASAPLSTQATTIDLGSNQTTKLIEVPVTQFHGQQIAVPSLFSFDLEFNKPVRVRSNSGMEMVLACQRSYWQTSWPETLSQLSSVGTYLLDSHGDWLPFGRPEIGVSPFNAMWLKVYIDDPMTIYGIRYDLHVPQMYFGQPDLWLRSREKPFTVGASVPESGGTLGYLSCGLVALLVAFRLRT